MKGVIFTGDRTLELRDLPEPEPGHGEVLLKMMASGMWRQRPYPIPDARVRDDRLQRSRTRALRRSSRSGPRRNRSRRRRPRDDAPLHRMQKLLHVSRRLYADVLGRQRSLRHRRGRRASRLPAMPRLYLREDAGRAARSIRARRSLAEPAPRSTPSSGFRCRARTPWPSSDRAP